MPTPIIEDTGLLYPAVTNLNLDPVMDELSFLVKSPVNFGVYIINNINIDIIKLTPLSELMNNINWFIPYNTQTRIVIRNTSTIYALFYEYNINDYVYNEYPKSIIEHDVVINCSQTRINITPDPSLLYNEPTNFSLIPPAGFDFFIVLNDAYYLPNVPFTEGAYVISKGLMLYENELNSITLDKTTKLSIFYYSNAYNSYYSNLDIYHDELVINFEQKLDFTIENYGKVASFLLPIEAKIVSTIPCTIIMTIIDIERKSQSVQELNVSNEMVISIDSTCSILLESVDKSISKKYLFKRELVKTVYSYYEENGLTKNNLFESNLFPSGSGASA